MHGGGTCMDGGGHVWQRGMHDQWACMVRGHAWQGGMHGGGHVWPGGGGVHGQGTMHGRGCVWQERRPLLWVVPILLECILPFTLSQNLMDTPNQ